MKMAENELFILIIRNLTGCISVCI